MEDITLEYNDELERFEITNKIPKSSRKALFDIKETDDDFIADLCFAFSCFGLKAGSPKKPERMLKYKRLIEISARGVSA